MCTVSMIADTFTTRWRRQYGPYEVQPPLQPWVQYGPPTDTHPWPWPSPTTKEEFDELKREVELLRDLIEAGKRYDEANGEPECETDEKMELLRRIADAVGVELP